MADPTFAIILAGGRGSRLGGVDKPSLQVGGRRLLDVALDAVAGTTRTVVVGPGRDLDSTILQTREDPPGAGPAFAVAAGLQALDAVESGSAGTVCVLAADVPFLTAAALDHLSRARATAGAPAAFALDSAGRMQYLIGVWDLGALRESVFAATGPAMRGLVPTAAIGVVLADDTVADVDTDTDLDRARSRALTRNRSHATARLTPPQASASLHAELQPVPATRRRTADAVGGVLVTGLVAAQPFPSFDTSAMDGYAVAGDGPWRVSTTCVAAGGSGHEALSPGSAVRIATGAMLPPGADRVIRDEEIDLIGETLHATAAFDRDDTRRRGSEWNEGDELIPAGTRVDEAVVSVARSAGVDSVDVRGPLRVVVHTTGDEVVPDTTRPGTIVDTASNAVRDLLQRNGCRTSSGEHLTDDPAVFARALRNSDVDLVVLIGATGRGVADHLRGALDEVTARVVVDGVDMRPGGSLLVATGDDGPVIVGLGGNPLAAVAGIALLTAPIVETMLSADPIPPQLIGVENLDSVARADGWRMTPVTPNGSGLWHAPQSLPTAHLLAFVSARGFALIPPGAHGADLVELLS